MRKLCPFLKGVRISFPPSAGVEISRYLNHTGLLNGIYRFYHDLPMEGPGRVFRFVIRYGDVCEYSGSSMLVELLQLMSR